MRKDELKSVIEDQIETVKQKFKTEKIVARIGKEKCLTHIKYPNALLITGIRRAGKSIFSHLLLSKMSYMHINFDDERLISATTSDLNLILECFYEINPNFEAIIFDEIQNIKGWELFANRLRERYKVIISGSNANLLSVDLATHLTGRYSIHTLYPLSFKEFIEFNSGKSDKVGIHSTKQKGIIQKLFDQYLNNGGIFEYYKFGKDFLRNLFSSIITRDIIKRYNINYPVILEELALLLINYYASKISVARLTKHLKIKSSHTAQKYLKYLENSFLFILIPKFSYKIQEQLSSFKKLYIIDNGLISSLSFGFMENKGRYLENLIAIELKRRQVESGGEIFYWDNYQHECDFLIKRGHKIINAIQVSYTLTEQNREKELKGLTLAMEAFNLKEGIIITHQEEDQFKIKNKRIRIIPATRWLLEI